MLDSGYYKQIAQRENIQDSKKLNKWFYPTPSIRPAPSNDAHQGLNVQCKEDV